MELPPAVDDKIMEDDPAYYLSVEIMPEPVGGTNAIQRKVRYPEQAREDGIEGTVKVKAFIDKFGEVTKAEVVDSLGYGCDEAARIAVFYTKFKPGLQRGKPVRVQMTIPVNFTMTKNEDE